MFLRPSCWATDYSIAGNWPSRVSTALSEDEIKLLMLCFFSVRLCSSLSNFHSLKFSTRIFMVRVGSFVMSS